MNFIYKLLDIEPNQATRVFLMLGVGFFMGIFLATLDVSASALFLQNFNEQTDLPVAIVISGITGILLTGLYNFLQSRLNYGTLAVLTLLGVVSLMAGLQLAFRFELIEDIKYIYGAAFVLVLPINYITLLIFWGVFGRIFTLRESKKIIGSIDTGQLIASILALFSIPLLQLVLSTVDLLQVSLWASVGVLMMVTIIVFKGLFTEIGKKKSGRISYVRMFRSKYLVLMSAFVVLSMIAVSFVDFAFLNATGQQFSGEALANFLSLFEATVVIFSFLFQTFVTDRIISMYGLRFSLIVNPLLILGFTGIATLMGSFFGFVKEGNTTFIFFFIIIAMSKLFIDALKDALDGPAFKLYFLPVDTTVRFDVQTKVEGVVTAFAGLLAGLLIILINNAGLSLLYITIFTLPLLFFWYLITNKMHNGYKQTLQNTLIRNKEKQNVSVRQEFAVNQVLENEIENSDKKTVLYSLKIMEKLEPAMFESAIIQLANSSDPELKKYAEDKIKSLHLHYEQGSEIHQLAKEALIQIDDSEVIDLNPRQLEKMGKSTNPKDRQTAARVLRTKTDNNNIFLLLELLRDINDDVRNEAIKTTRKVHRSETWPVLIDMLDSVKFGRNAMSSIIENGEQALPALEMAFSKSGQRDTVMMKIITAIGRIGGEKAIKLLWDKIDYPDKRIASQTLIWLRYFNYEAKRELERQTIIELLEDDISKAIWNMSAIEELPDKESYKILTDALQEELDENNEHIFMLLSLLYDKQSIQLVRENIETGSSEGITFALELMDIFIDKDLRPKLFPLFDDIDRIDKLHQLQIYFPREEYKPKEVLNFILNRNFDQANRWTKAAALHAMAFMDEFKVTKAMVAQLFNPDYLLQETASWLVYHKDRVMFEKVAKRLDSEQRKALEDSISRNQLIDGLDDGAFLRIEMAMFMKEIDLLSNIRGAQLCNLADRMQVIQLKEGETINLTRKFEDSPILIVAEGILNIEYNENESSELKKHDVFGELFVITENIIVKDLIALSDTVIFSISATDFYSIMGDNHKLVQEMITSVTDRLKSMTTEN